MKKLILAFATLSLSAFSVENCKDPLDLSDYKGTITKESEVISFGGCPDSLLVNGKL